MLRLGRHLLGAATGTRLSIARQQAGKSADDQAGHDRVSQYRLPDASAVRYRDAGTPLGRIDRRRTCQSRLIARIHAAWASILTETKSCVQLIRLAVCRYR